MHRVRDWRVAHPGYWRRVSADATPTAADSIDLRTVLETFFARDSCDALQDSWPPYVVALVGLIVRLGGHTPDLALQDPIARDFREIMVEGNAILAALETPHRNGDASLP